MSWRRPSLAAQVLIGFVLGIGMGLFFGEDVQPLSVVGQAFGRLLQMSVMPYMLVSVLTAIGHLEIHEARRLVARAGLLLLSLWALGLGMVAILPLAFPRWETGSFFSTTMIGERTPADLLHIYIPANPFQALAEGTVPGVVLFALAFGVALMGVAGRGSWLDDLQVIQRALTRITSFIARLAPIGVFSLAASAAGTMTIDQFEQVQVYVVIQSLMAGFMALVVLPALVATLTPLRYMDVLRESRDALVTAFATGNVLVVLPLLAERAKRLLRRDDVIRQDDVSMVDVFVPLSFNFPNLGKLMALGFLPFAGWFLGTPLGFDQMLTLLGSGFLALFGEPSFAIPFLLDRLQLPSDLLQLFLAVDVITGRMAMLVAASYTITLALIGSCSMAGLLRFRPMALVHLGVLTGGIGLGLLGGTRLFFTYVLPQKGQTYERLADRNLITPQAELAMTPAPPAQPGRDRLTVIRGRNILNVGYVDGGLPYAFRNTHGQMVGLDVAMAHLLARDLHVKLALVSLQADDVARALADGQVDIVMSGLQLTTTGASVLAISKPIMEETAAFVVLDHRRSTFSDLRQLDQGRNLVIAMVGQPPFLDLMRDKLPLARFEKLPSPRPFFTQGQPKYDALLLTAETGAAWTLIYPAYSVTIPSLKAPIKVPLIYALPQDQDAWRHYVNAFVVLRQADNTIEQLKSYWIMGQHPDGTARRWSVWRDVLHQAP